MGCCCGKREKENSEDEIQTLELEPDSISSSITLDSTNRRISGQGAAVTCIFGNAKAYFEVRIDPSERAERRQP